MKYQNNATRIRREILMRIARAFRAGTLQDEIDRIPLAMFPHQQQEQLRCCVYKERAIVKQRILSALGFGVEEDDEVVPISIYLERALSRNRAPDGSLLSVLDIACSGCVSAQYFITNACRGCMARPCTLNCPKNAIEVVKGQSVIDYDKCVDCGRCAQVCPYKAIVRVPIPCEDACPVGAIHKDTTGKAVIDFAKCISCGRCMVACPFGAVMEKSHFIDLMRELKSEHEVIALVAPSIAGQQFKGDLTKIASALIKLGFNRVVEVAGGADITAKHEAVEFQQRLDQGEQFMTSSCCPAYTETVERHIPELKPHLSQAKTPMHYTAAMVRELYPAAKTVFIGPCIAKRKEAQTNQHVDYVVTFEEIEALISAAEIDVANCDPAPLENSPSDAGRGFGTTCGVTDAMLQTTNPDLNLEVEFIDGLDKAAIKRLRQLAKNPGNINFVEVMGCEGGCVGGPCAIGKLQSAKRAIRKLAGSERKE